MTENGDLIIDDFLKELRDASERLENENEG